MMIQGEIFNLSRLSNLSLGSLVSLDWRIILSSHIWPNINNNGLKNIYNRVANIILEDLGKSSTREKNILGDKTCGNRFTTCRLYSHSLTHLNLRVQVLTRPKHAGCYEYKAFVHASFRHKHTPHLLHLRVESHATSFLFIRLSITISTPNIQ